MATQQIGADGGYKNIVIGGPMELLPHFTQIRQVKDSVTVYPGYFVSGNGETEGQVDLAASGDGTASFIEIVIEESPYPSSIPTDGSAIIDQGITGSDTSPTFVKTLRQTGLFTVVCLRADESNNTELGEPMVLEATGMIKKWAYTDTAEATDCLIEFVGRCANVTTDVADTDLVQELYF